MCVCVCVCVCVCPSVRLSVRPSVRPSYEVMKSVWCRSVPWYGESFQLCCIDNISYRTMILHNRDVAIEELTFVCLNAASVTLNEDLHTVVAGNIDFSLNVLLCNTQYFCIGGWKHVAQQHTQKVLFCFHCNHGFANMPQFFCYMYITCLVIFNSVYYFPCL